jgi:hypothetical protein
VLEIVAREGADPKPRDLENLARLVEKEHALEREARMGPGGAAAKAGKAATSGPASWSVPSSAPGAAPAVSLRDGGAVAPSSSPVVPATPAAAPPTQSGSSPLPASVVEPGKLERPLQVGSLDTVDILPPPAPGPQPRL